MLYKNGLAWKDTSSWCGLFKNRTIILQSTAWFVAMAAILICTASVQAHATDTSVAPLGSLAFEGLIPATELCDDDYWIEGTELCTHGPDMAPTHLDRLDSAEALAGLQRTASSVICDGDGVSGKRVQLMYVRSEDVPDRYDEYVDSFRTMAIELDLIFDASAHATGGHRHVRYVTDEDCQAVILNIVVPASANDSFRSAILAVREQGFNDPDRKYLMFADANVYCGIATVISDTRPTPDNRNNHQPGYARVDNGCWRHSVAAHELVHLFGGVQTNAPNSSGGWHCVDEWDLMCYSDSPYYPSMEYICPVNNQWLLDCNHDDYYHTNPPAGSYLATNWNVANSAFLIDRDEVHNLPPEVEISQPNSSAAFTAPATITITAQASDSDGVVTKVEFYHEATLLATVTDGPYTFGWTEVVSGTYTITAKAFDDAGASTTSEPLIILVMEAPAGPPDDTEEGAPRVSNTIYLPFVSRQLRD